MGNINSPVGRIVWGNPLIAKQRRDDNNKPKIKDDGTPDMVYSFGLAVPKQEFGPIYAVMQQEAMGVFPNGQFPADFAWKFVDGDGVDRKGQPYSKRTGYAGHYVLAVESNFPIRVVQYQGGAYADMTQGVKTGDYVVLNFDIVGHGSKPGVRMSKPGLYLNPRMVCFVGYGEEINNAPDAADVFGNAQFALPPGASATPLAPSAPLPQGMPGAMPQGMLGQMPQGMPGAAPAQHGLPGSTTASPSYQPAHDFVQGAVGGMPGMPGAGAVGGLPGMPGMPQGLPGMPGVPR